MSRSHIRIDFDGDSAVMSWDGSQASATIRVDGTETQYQTADARHRVSEAVRLVAGLTWPEAGSFAEDSEEWAQLAYETLPDEPTVST